MTESIFHMSNLAPSRTGLPFVVWIAVGSGIDHDFCVWVSRTRKIDEGGLVAVEINPAVRVVAGLLSSSDLDLLAHWITLNRVQLSRHWTGEIDSKEALDSIIPI